MENYFHFPSLLLMMKKNTQKKKKESSRESLLCSQDICATVGSIFIYIDRYRDI